MPSQFGGVSLDEEDQPARSRFGGEPVAAPVGQGEFGDDSSAVASPSDVEFAIRHGRTRSGKPITPASRKADVARTEMSLARGRDVAERDILLKHFPDATVEQDAEGRDLVTIPELGVERQHINAPGISPRDLDQFLTTLTALAGPGGKISAIKSTIGRIFGSSALAAGETVAQDAAVKASVGTDVDFVDAGIAAAFGGAFEAFGAPVINTVARMFRRSNGQLTPQIREALIAIDVDPDALNRNQIVAIQQMADQSPQQINQLFTHDLGLEFGVRQTKADRTLDPDDIVREANLRRKAPDRFQEFEEGRAQDLIDATRNIQARRLNKGAADVATENEGGSVIRERLTKRRTTLEGQIEEAYTKFDQADAHLEAGALGQFLESQRAAIDDAADLVPLGDPKTLTPATNGILKGFEDLAAQIRELPPGSDPLVAIQNLEKLRRRINNNINAAANPTDKRAATQLKANFDQFVDDAVDNALIRGEDAATVMEQLKDARKLRTEMRLRFSQRNPKDDAGKILEKIVTQDVDDAGVVDLIFGRSQLGGKNASVHVIRRIKETAGEGSPEFQALREMAFLRLVRPKGTGRTFDRAVFLRDVNEALTGQGEPLMRELFNVDERAMLNRFRLLVARSLPKDLRSGQRFGPRITEAIRNAAEEFTKMRARGTVFQGQALRGTFLRALPDMIRDLEARRVINGRLKEPNSKIVDFLRPHVLGATPQASEEVTN